MGTLTKDTFKILKYNQRNGFIFTLLFRLITTPLYLLALNAGLKFALKMADYSYLTVSNIGLFLIKPWTAVTIAALLILGILVLLLEAGCLITLYQGAFYFRKLNLWQILAGGLSKLLDELRRKNWQLGLLVLADYFITNVYLIYRVFTHVKPINFVTTEILRQPLGRMALAAVILMLLLIVLPGLYTFHACMVEQKRFRDGYLKSWWLLRRRIFEVLPLMFCYYGLAILALWMLYGFCVLITAIAVTLFTDNRLALAVLPAACDWIELVLIFFSSMLLAVGKFGAVSVQYFRFNSRITRKAAAIGYEGKPFGNRKTAGLIMAAASALCLMSLFYVLRNGSVITGDMLSEIQITAHRGSSNEAPENTMAALHKAVNDLADYAEIDVQETRDGIVVLGHDYTLNRVAGVNRSISSYDYEDLVKLDVGSWFSDEYKEERIPTLKEVMEYCKGKINLNIEIKNMGEDSNLPDKVMQLIEEYQMEEQCVVTSTRFSYLVRIKKADPQIRTGYIISAAYGDFYSSDSIDFISLRSSFINERLVEAAHEKGKAVHAWTVNGKSEMERMKMLGVDNIITDYPILAREIIYREAATESLLEYLQLVLK